MQTLQFFIAQSFYNLKNAYALASSFWVGVFSMMMNNATFFIIWYLFMQTTGPINGWTTWDVFGMIGVAMFTYGVTHGFFYGLVDLPQSVLKGTFDGVLLSPTNAFFRLSGSSFSVTAYGDLLQGMAAFLLYGVVVQLSIVSWLLFAVAILIGCVILVCFRLLSSLIVFYIHDGDVVAGQVFDIFLRPGLYPGAIFPDKLKLFFMTAMPALLTSAMPIDVVKNHSLTLVATAVAVTVFWVAFTSLLFRYAVRRYESGNFLR